ncbi:MAG TPA: TolC family protein, partial [Verrucomicrobiae bacterium]|nr:TolC family protein [Verrucomicrobiae bacterium]
RALLVGCAHYHPKTISAEKTVELFNARSLTNAALQAFLATNHTAVPGPNDSWDLKQLTLVAFYYQPSLAEARAQLLAAQAAEITAGERPNPSVSVTPGYDNHLPTGVSPWVVPLTFDVPLETAGKRGKRIAQATNQMESARWNLVGTAWQVRSQIRTALLNLYSSCQTLALVSQQELAQSNVVHLQEGQRAAGAISEFEVTQARTALENTRLARQDAIGKSKQALVDMAHALGIPTSAMSDVNFSVAPFDNFPEDLTRAEVRRDALLNRADVRGALADYAASQSALQIEIANQYPDVHLGPGYTWNGNQTGDSQWSLGLTVTLPILNHNEGPVAEAEAKRTQAAAHFMTVQANAVAEIDGALAGYHAALEQVATANSLLEDSQKRLDSFRAQQKAGAAEPADVATAEVEFATSAQNRLNALVQAQQALGRLEDAVQNPLTLPAEVLAGAVSQEPQAEVARPPSRKETAK